jgi:hypothetical protein
MDTIPYLPIWYQLMLGMNELLFRSDQIGQADFKLEPDKFNITLVDHPLKSTFRSLRNILESPSKTVLERAAKRSANATKRTPQGSASDKSGTPASTSASSVTPKAEHRVASGSSEISSTSFGQNSVHSTPEKKSARETSVQPLQNAFVDEILMHLWPGGDVPIPWLESRKMVIRYVTYIT